MRLLLILLLIISTTIAAADELEQAYEKEYAYLVAEKKALEQRLGDMKKQQGANLKTVKSEIDALQQDFLRLQSQTDRLNRQIVDASRGVENTESDVLLLDTTLSQARESFSKLGRQVNETATKDSQLTEAFRIAGEVLHADSATRAGKGSFYLTTGETVEGTVLEIGRIARYGFSESGSGILAPAGGGDFKIWDATTNETAKSLLQGQSPQEISVFLFDNANQAVEKDQEKTFGDEVDAGGAVGKVIIFLGIAGLILVVIRVVLLARASANIQKIADEVSAQISSGNTDNALEICKKHMSAAANVIAATVRNLNRDRDHIEDIISESILHESSLIDRYGSAILVIAAVSPLLGLLGTVTGMISTFDIITTYGTGDPKLLSSGISEALLTTKFGLVVAIPLLLLGNILSSWGQTIKNEMEQAALHMINTHKS